MPADQSVIPGVSAAFPVFAAPRIRQLTAGSKVFGMGKMGEKEESAALMSKSSLRNRVLPAATATLNLESSEKKIERDGAQNEINDFVLCEVCPKLCNENLARSEVCSLFRSFLTEQSVTRSQAVYGEDEQSNFSRRLFDELALKIYERVKYIISMGSAGQAPLDCGMARSYFELKGL
jgi:hypothetical protein